MAPISSLAYLTNPSATPAQLSTLVSSGSPELSPSTRFTTLLLTQSAGILLRLPQPVIASALIILQRYWLCTASEHELPSEQDRPGAPDSRYSPKNLSSASIYLAAKLSSTPVSPRSVLNVYAYLLSPSSPLPFINAPSSNATTETPPPPPDPSTYYLPEGLYQSQRLTLFKIESHLLAAVGFHVPTPSSSTLPQTLALTYLSTLLPSQSFSHTTLARRTLSHLNAALLNPVQYPYLTHGPNQLACAAIYLAAREVGVKLVDGNWWELFDVEREDLGFLVLCLGSFEGWVGEEVRRWNDRGADVRDGDGELGREEADITKAIYPQG